MDLLGVRLGMSVKEAESALRSSQQIQTVYRFSAPPTGTYAAVSSTAQPFEPYSSGLLFVANDGKDVIALFYRNEGEVIGISRRMLAQGLTEEDLTVALSEKYGKPTRTDRSGWIWGQTGKGLACAGHGRIDARSAMELLQGKPVKHVTYGAVGIGVRREVKADALSNCHTVLQVGANLAGTAKPHVEFRLFNHSMIAGALGKIEDRKNSSASKAAKDLDL
jgi:hypothetical protein